MDDVEEKIRQALETRATSLDLNDLGLEVLPPEISRLSQLRALDLSSNQLLSLPPEISQLTRLQILDLRSNQLASVPAGVFQLSQLKTLVLSDNRLGSLPPEISRLSQLQILVVSFNWLESLPAEICQLCQLQTLDLRSNQLASLPAEIGQLRQLQTLDLDDNQLASLPPEMGRLRQLQTLYLHWNTELEIPPEILGPTRSELTKAPADPGAILEFYRCHRPQRSRPLCEAKILVVGQGAVGKTSLVRCLVETPFDPEQSSTAGIDIVRWHVAAREETPQIAVNIWDFGGQEILHAAHQFFFTRRGLYLLVLDAGKSESESNLYCWLRIIQSFGGKAPVLVVSNKSEAPHFLELNENRLKKDYAPNLRGFFRTSCRDGTGIAELAAAITREVGALEHVGTEVPSSFLEVEKAVEARARSRCVIDVADYESLCEAQGIEQASDQQQLLRLLHDLGWVLHFSDPDCPYRLKETKILDPEWLTRGVYKILNNDQLLQNGGVLTRGMLAKILTREDGYSKKGRLFILGMMRKFELCFEFADGSNRRLVPELLNRNEPDLGLGAEDAVRFELHYDVLPDGILPRFIVRTHAYLTVLPTYWRSGVLLGIEGNRALVRGDTQTGRVFLAVFDAPSGRRQALSLLRTVLAAINRTIPGLGVKEMVPLPGHPGRAVAYKHLKWLEAEGEQIYLDGSVRQRFQVRELLDSVEQELPEAGREPEPEPEQPSVGVELEGLQDPAPQQSQTGPGLGHHERRHPRDDLPERPEVFLSYAWGGESEVIAEEVATALAKLPLQLQRDKHDLGFKGSIRGFIERLGDSRAIVVVISHRYLKSKYCMFELAAIFEAGEFRRRIFPVVAEDARIYDAEDLVDYLLFWEEKRDLLDEKLNRLKGRAHVEGLQEDLSLYDKIRDLIARLAVELRDMNTLSAREHRESGFAELTRALAAEMGL